MKNTQQVIQKLLLRLTQREVSKLLGVSDASVSFYVSGDREPRWATARKLARISGHELAYDSEGRIRFVPKPEPVVAESEGA